MIQALFLHVSLAYQAVMLVRTRIRRRTLVTQQAIRRGSFRSVRELIRCINEFVQHYNRRSRPFAWSATADSIFQKLSRLCSRISGTAH